MACGALLVATIQRRRGPYTRCPCRCWKTPRCRHACCRTFRGDPVDERQTHACGRGHGHGLALKVARTDQELPIPVKNAQNVSLLRAGTWMGRTVVAVAKAKADVTTSHLRLLEPVKCASTLDRHDRLKRDGKLVRRICTSAGDAYGSAPSQAHAHDRWWPAIVPAWAERSDRNF